MASVNSPIRKLIKPVIMKVLGPRAYRWFFVRGKIRDIDHRLVEEAEMALLPRLVGPRDTVLDIGANFAYYTVRLAKLVPQGKVIAFEPIPSTYDACRRIVRHYGLTNVELHDKGVGERPEKMRFEVPLQELGTHSAGQAHMAGRNNKLEGFEKYHAFTQHESFDCDIVALDAFLGNVAPVSFIKIDIEGAELFALRGMKERIARDRPHVLIEICPFFLKGFGIVEGELAGWFEALGYRGFGYDPRTQRLRPAAPPYADGNYIFVHRDRIAPLGDLIETAAARPGATHAAVV